MHLSDALTTACPLFNSLCHRVPHFRNPGTVRCSASPFRRVRAHRKKSRGVRARRMDSPRCTPAVPPHGSPQLVHVRLAIEGGGVNRAPQNWGWGGWEKGSIDRSINHLL